MIGKPALKGETKFGRMERGLEEEEAKPAVATGDGITVEVEEAVDDLEDDFLRMAILLELCLCLKGIG